MPDPNTVPSPVFADMLAALKRAHAEVHECIRELALLTTLERASRVDYTRARFRISSASMTRRNLFAAACAALAADSSAHEAEVIERLGQGDRALLAKSAAHIRRWPTEAVAANWRGYCADARLMRSEMATGLRKEETLLFPLLERRARGQQMRRLLTRAA